MNELESIRYADNNNQINEEMQIQILSEQIKGVIGTLSAAIELPSIGLMAGRNSLLAKKEQMERAKVKVIENEPIGFYPHATSMNTSMIGNEQSMLNSTHQVEYNNQDSDTALVNRSMLTPGLKQQPITPNSRALPSNLHQQYNQMQKNLKKPGKELDDYSKISTKKLNQHGSMGSLPGFNDTSNMLKQSTNIKKVNKLSSSTSKTFIGAQSNYKSRTDGLYSQNTYTEQNKGEEIKGQRNSEGPPIKPGNQAAISPK